MKTLQRTFINPLKKIFLPGTGQSAHYLCHSCGKKFNRTIHFVIRLLKNCPKCGSFLVYEGHAVVN